MPKNSINNFLLSLLSLITVYGNGSLIKTASPYIFHFTAFSLFVLYIFVNKNLVKVKPAVISIIVMTFLSSAINISNNINISNLFSFSFYLVLFSVITSKHKYILLDKISNIIHVLVIISIIFKIVLFAFPSLWSIIPITKNIPQYPAYYNVLVFTQNTASTLRNQGIYWEPGAWAVNQIIAYYWLIIIRKRYNLLIYFTLSMILTLSTSGMILFIIMLLYLLIYEKSFREKYRTKIFILSLIIVSFFSQLIYKNYQLFDLSYIFLANTFDKYESLIKFRPLKDYYSKDYYVSTYNEWGSFEDRLHTYAVAYYDTKKKPFFGLGRVEGSYPATIYQTSTFGQIMIQHGFVYLFLWYFLFFRAFIFKSNLFKIIFILILTYAEPYAFGTIYILLIVIGANIKKFKVINDYLASSNKKVKFMLS